MKNYKFCLINSLLIISYLIGVGCKSNPDSTTIASNNNDKMFKTWVRDTTNLIKENPDKIAEGLVRSQFTISQDSLLFDEIKSYEFNSKNTTQNEEILNVISLLENYDELPKKGYMLSFITRKSFYPSMIPNLKYDFTFEITKLIVKVSDMEIDYKYIRGRLSGKKMNPNGKNQKSILYDFDWKGKNLIKRKISD